MDTQRIAIIFQCYCLIHYQMFRDLNDQQKWRKFAKWRNSNDPVQDILEPVRAVAVRMLIDEFSPHHDANVHTQGKTKNRGGCALVEALTGKLLSGEVKVPTMLRVRSRGDGGKPSNDGAATDGYGVYRGLGSGKRRTLKATYNHAGY